MPIQIEVQDAHAQLLIEFYIGRLKSLREEILDREKETKDINGIIQKLKKKDSHLASPASSSFPETHYSEKWPWVRKVQYAMKKEGRALTTKEIVDVLTENEPTFLFDRKRAIASISSILSSKSGNDKDFIRVENDSGDFAYDINKEKDAKQVIPIRPVEPPDDDLPF